MLTLFLGVACAGTIFFAYTKVSKAGLDEKITNCRYYAAKAGIYWDGTGSSAWDEKGYRYQTYQFILQADVSGSAKDYSQKPPDSINHNFQWHNGWGYVDGGCQGERNPDNKVPSSGVKINGGKINLNYFKTPGISGAFSFRPVDVRLGKPNLNSVNQNGFVGGYNTVAGKIDDKLWVGATAGDGSMFHSGGPVRPSEPWQNDPKVKFPEPSIFSTYAAFADDGGKAWIRGANTPAAGKLIWCQGISGSNSYCDQAGDLPGGKYGAGFMFVSDNCSNDFQDRVPTYNPLTNKVEPKTSLQNSCSSRAQRWYSPYPSGRVSYKGLINGSGSQKKNDLLSDFYLYGQARSTQYNNIATITVLTFKYKLPDISFTCNGITEPSVIETGTSYTLKAGFKYDKGYNGYNVGKYQIELGSKKYTFPNPTNINVGSSINHDFSGLTAPSTPQTFTLTYSLIDSSNDTIVTCDKEITVYNKPYLRVYGGDVLAGAGFSYGDGGDCDHTPGSRFIGHGNDTQGFGYRGAGAQYAVFARGQNLGFASAILRGETNYPIPLKGLTFAKDNSSYKYGGLFKGGMSCAKDYFAAAPSSGDTGGLVSAGGNTAIISRSGDVTITGGDVNAGADRTIYVDGNAYITGDIKYADWNSLQDIPRFRLIVRGNIYVAAGVTQLDGIYIAQPKYNDARVKQSNTGRFYTCATGFGGPSGAQIATDCNNKLTIYGAVSADLIKPLRSNGSMSKGVAVDNEAETIIFGPEVWLKAGTPSANRIESYRSMPPIL